MSPLVSSSPGALGEGGAGRPLNRRDGREGEGSAEPSRLTLPKRTGSPRTDSHLEIPWESPARTRKSSRRGPGAQPRLTSRYSFSGPPPHGGLPGCSRTGCPEPAPARGAPMPRASHVRSRSAPKSSSRTSHGTGPGPSTWVRSILRETLGPAGSPTAPRGRLQGSSKHSTGIVQHPAGSEALI